MVEDIFSEVDADLRNERSRLRARRLALAGLAALLLLGIAVGIWQYAVHRHRDAILAAAPGFFAAQTLADMAPAAAAGPDAPPTAQQMQAIDRFGAIARGGRPVGFATLSRLRMAALDWRAGNKAAALGLWDQVSHDGAADPDLRGLGTLLWVQHGLDDADPALLKTRLRDILAAGSPWRLLATETDALIDLRENHVAEARTKLTAITRDDAASQSERARAGAILTTLDTSKTGG